MLDKMLAQEAEIISKVRDILGTREKAELWYSLANPHFGNASPEQLVKMGRGHKVLQFIEAAIEANTPPNELPQSTTSSSN